MTDAPAPIRFDGKPLPLASLAAALHGPVRAELTETARLALRKGRAALEAAAAAGQPIYGMTTGVGALKHQCHAGTAMDAFNHSLGLAHEVAVGEPVAAGIARLALVLRLNTLSTGRSGVSEGFADCLAKMIDHDILPRMTRRGSVGCGDLGQLGQLATAMTGVGTVLWHGQEMPAATAFAAVGITPYQMRPREGLAAVASNSFSLSAALAAVFDANARIHQTLAQAPVMALAWGLDRAVWQAAETSLMPKEAAVARALIVATADQTDWPARGSVQDALSARFMVQVLAPCLTAAEEALDTLHLASGQVDDNPTVLPDGRVVTSGASHHAQLSLRLGALQSALAMLGRNLFNKCLMLTNGQLPGLPVNLVPEGVVATGYGPLMKLAMEQSARIATSAAPVAPHALTLAAGLEDEALLLPLTAERISEQAEALGWLLTISALLSVQAVALRGIAPRGPAADLTARVRAHVPPFVGDIPLTARLTALRASLDARALDPARLFHKLDEPATAPIQQET
ncbi:histidine ammonia-lyase [Rhodobacter viridis]|uniref:Histidine ammonia-lyase n=1 Tax=Rhodobacter viridis TaxID=1054202 RepID=A0A318TYJ2_9RHOB|nr:aromatic amino acid lyase [Rhodobacter viridis]PYF09897.1 histidine ammonia-lyase [Rhodobacter viridis]